MAGHDYATTLNAEKILNKNNINVNYRNHIRMVDNTKYLTSSDYIPFKTQSEIQQDIMALKEDIENHKEYKLDINTSAKTVSKITSLSTVVISQADRLFKSNENCVGCLLCTQACPKGNIEVEDNKLKFNHNCEACLCCINICPNKAIQAGNSSTEKQYINENVSVRELIEK